MRSSVRGMDGDAATPNVIRRDRFLHMEARFYALSPLGFWGTTLALMAVTFGAYVLIAETTGRPGVFELLPQCAPVGTDICDATQMARFEAGWNLPFDGSDRRYELERVTWIGFVLSLILTTALALSENSRRVWNNHKPALIRSLPDRARADAEAISEGVDGRWRLAYTLAFAGGFVGGLAFNALMLMGMGVSPLQYINSIGLWFLIFSPFLYGLGFRAGVDLARESGEIKRLIRTHLDVDLFHLDRLQVYGRIGMRGALSWMIMAAILLLFIADPDQVFMTGPAVGLAVAGGGFILASAVHPVHLKIREAKQAELDRVHDEIRSLRDLALDGDREAGSALAGLTDYERWVEQRSEWPISMSTGLRFSVYVLIPILPIIGSYVFERFADGMLRVAG